MPWKIWKRPTPGEKINYWKKPDLETINEGEIRGFYLYFPRYPSETMTDNQQLDWGNGPATSTNIKDEWNDGGATENWQDNGATGHFDSGAQQSSGFDDAEAGDARGSGGCFNCGEDGMFCSSPIQTHTDTLLCHMKSDCPNPRVDKPFDGQCRFCNET